MAIGTYISITTLNVNGLNAPNKRHRLAEWIQKQEPDTCWLQETHYFASRVCIVKAIIFPVVKYGCESWTIKKAE